MNAEEWKKMADKRAAERVLLHPAMFEPDPVPVGFTACAAEWDAGVSGDRPYDKRLWTELTFGDQQRYGEIEMAASGAGAVAKATPTGFAVEIELPMEFRGIALSESEQRWFKAALEKEARKTMHWMMTSRQNGWHT